MNQEFLSAFYPSDEKVFPATLPTGDYAEATAFSDEAFSFVFAFRHAAPGIPWEYVSVRATCEGLPISAYKVGYVALTDREERTTAYPDILMPRSASPEVKATGDRLLPYDEIGEKHCLLASSRATAAVLFAVNEEERTLTAGDYRIAVEAVSLKDGRRLALREFTLHILPATLGKADLIYTNWFHYDCVADYHSIPLYSEEYFALLEKYFRQATRHGMSMILTPAFTPALDTPVGYERMRTQLVGIRRDGGRYTFDFSLLERFLRLADACGFTYFEHAHLFSQWGAAHAPSIYATVDGEERRIFGWDSDASGEEYREFLHTYLTELLAFAEHLGYADRFFFHISDEPSAAHEESYRLAVEGVRNLLAGRLCGDALSDYAYYEKGFVSLPVVHTLRLPDFDGRCDSMMMYYTGGEGRSANRRIDDAPARTRILGLLLYRYNARGFLHWGYNFYYGNMSHGLFDPKNDPCFYKNMPGVTYLAYPTADRDVMPSLREKYMKEAINDYRALRLLETYVGREAVLALCREYFGGEADYLTQPASAEEMLSFRVRINAEIEKHL